MRKPLIGVMPLFDTARKSMWMLPNYMQGIQAAGGLPMILPFTEDKMEILRMTQMFDGFLLTGGHDVAPSLYGEAKLSCCGDVSVERDRLEQLLLQYALAEDKPVFGICRGIQLMNVVLGGTLYQDLPTQAGTKITHSQSSNYAEPVHNVAVFKDTPLRSILQQEELAVDSLHHQGIKDLAPQLRCAAVAEDGLIEAAYMPEKKFALAVQWHPEYMYQTDRGAKQLFQAFVAACE